MKDMKGLDSLRDEECSSISSPELGDVYVGMFGGSSRMATISYIMSMWVCLKIGYIPNYSHLIGIMIINHWV